MIICFKLLEHLTEERWLMCSEPTEWSDQIRLSVSIHFFKFFTITFSLISSREGFSKIVRLKLYLSSQISKIYHSFMSVSLDLGAGTRRAVTETFTWLKKIPTKWKKNISSSSLQSHDPISSMIILFSDKERSIS